MRRALIIGIAFAVSACGGLDLPMADEASNLSGKSFGQPTPGRAAVYVTNPKGQYINISVGQRNLGIIGKGNWMRVDVPAGTYDIQCRLEAYASPPARLPVTLAEGSVTFVSTRFIPLGTPPCGLSVSTSDAGRADVLAGQRVRELSD